MFALRMFAAAFTAPFTAISRVRTVAGSNLRAEQETCALLQLSDLELRRRGLSRDALVGTLFLGQLYA